MNNRQNGRRRGRGGNGQPQQAGRPGGPDRGNRIDNRARGNASQLHEKYKSLARDAQMQGDRVNAEYYLQFADHYFRVLNENRARFEEQRPRRDDFGQEYGNEGDPDENYADGDTDGDEPMQAEAPRYEQPRHEQPRRTRRDEAPAAEAPRETQNEQREPREQREERRPRRRPRAEDDAAAVPAPRIEHDRLPPAFASAEPRVDVVPANDPADGEDKPRRRTRRPRSEAVIADA